MEYESKYMRLLYRDKSFIVEYDEAPKGETFGLRITLSQYGINYLLVNIRMINRWKYLDRRIYYLTKNFCDTYYVGKPFMIIPCTLYSIVLHKDVIYRGLKYDYSYKFGMDDQEMLLLYSTYHNRLFIDSNFTLVSYIPETGSKPVNRQLVDDVMKMLLIRCHRNDYISSGEFTTSEQLLNHLK